MLRISRTLFCGLILGLGYVTGCDRTETKTYIAPNSLDFQIPEDRSKDVLMLPAFQPNTFRTKLHTVRSLKEFSEISHFSIHSSTDFRSIYGFPTEQSIGVLLANAQPISPDSDLFEKWAYSPWCSLSFHSNGRKWKVNLYLGELGFITDDAGRTGAFLLRQNARDISRFADTKQSLESK